MKKQTGKKKPDIISILLILIGAGMILFALMKLIPILTEYHEDEQAYRDLREDYVKVDEELKTKSEEVEQNPNWWYQNVYVDLDKLREANPDVVGWIRFDEMNINYPIVYSGDNDTYLRADLNKEYSKAGTLFIDKKNQPDFSDGNTIIYGHNMKNGSMFGKLKNYKKDNFYEENQYFTIYTTDRAMRYHIYAYHDIEETDSYFFTTYEGEKALGDLISFVKRKSYQDTGVEVTADDKTVTLVTCSAEKYRFLVHAVLEETHYYEEDAAESGEE